ncbi:MAG TPA: hypothetical protein VEU96_29515 [Bryobacteraceae bacterium]|nr:hypothetical protein [Bryobacteraceae bacterium]
MIRTAILSVIICGVLPLAAQSVSEKTDDSAWKKLEFVLGKWTGTAGEKDTPHGAGGGGFSFEPELNRKIVIRKNNAAYNSGLRHDDLMVIYLDEPKDTPRAIYFDTEGHIIRYNLTFPAPNNVVFESDGTQPGPRYRLSYWLNGRALDGKFEVAPPGAEYKPYMQWTAKRD